MHAVSKLGMPIRSCVPRSAGEYDISPKSGSCSRPTNGIIVPQFGKKEFECPPVNVMDESGLWAWRVHVFQCLSFLLFFTSSSLHHFSIIKLCFSVYYYHPPCRTKRTLRILRERLTSSQVRIPFCGVFHPVSNKGRLRWHNLHARHRPRPSLQPRRR